MLLGLINGFKTPVTKLSIRADKKVERNGRSLVTFAADKHLSNGLVLRLATINQLLRPNNKRIYFHF